MWFGADRDGKDITYRYGFTESAFNFQQNNNGNGGRANDRVTISVQDSAGTDNADFTTPAEWVAPACTHSSNADDRAVVSLVA